MKLELEDFFVEDVLYDLFDDDHLAVVVFVFVCCRDLLVVIRLEELEVPDFVVP